MMTNGGELRWHIKGVVGIWSLEVSTEGIVNYIGSPIYRPYINLRSVSICIAESRKISLHAVIQCVSSLSLNFRKQIFLSRYVDFYFMIERLDQSNNFGSINNKMLSNNNVGINLE